MASIGIRLRQVKSGGVRLRQVSSGGLGVVRERLVASCSDMVSGVVSWCEVSSGGVM